MGGAHRIPTVRDMGRLQFLLWWVFPQVWGSSAVLGRSFVFRCLQISSFANSSWWRTDGLAWLGELQTHSWSNASDKISFVKPWAQGTFSSQQWDQLQNVFRGYRSSVTRDIQEFAKMLSLEYPIELQGTAGCEVHPGNISENFLHVAYQGEYIMSFQGTAWESAPQAPRLVDLVIKVLNQDQGTTETLQELLKDTCPKLVNGMLETGMSELEKQVKPQAWLSSGPSPGPGRLLLVCHVSGFCPQPVWVMWVRGEQEQQDTQRGDIVPNADGTWYLRATLDVAAGEAAGLACRVKHSSLGGQDLVLYWDLEVVASNVSLAAGCDSTLQYSQLLVRLIQENSRWEPHLLGLIVLAVLTCLVSLFMLILGLTSWIRKRGFYEDIL